jgi:hypothetical protein
MKKHIVITFLFLFSLLLPTGCSFQVVQGSGNVVREMRDVHDFSKIEFNGFGNVIITQGQKYELIIEAEDNLIQYFETDVQTNTLAIGIKKDYFMISIKPLKPINFYVTLPEIDAITLAGSGSITVNDLETNDLRFSLLGSGDLSTKNITANSINIELHGSGDMTFGKLVANSIISTTLGSGDMVYQNLAVKTVDISITGSGNVDINEIVATSLTANIFGSGNITMIGKVDEQSGQITGSGDYKCSELQSTTSNIRVTGSGNSWLYVTQILEIEITGSGDVTYSGTPNTAVAIRGSGDIYHIGQP